MEPPHPKSTQGDKDTKRKITEMKYFTRRWVLAYLLCVVRICQTALRQCIGMALVCMTDSVSFDVTVAAVEDTSLLEVLQYNVTTSVNATATPHVQRGEFLWSRGLEGHILGAYYYGFLMTVMMAGYVDRCLGSVRTIAVGIAGGGVVNLLTPVLTRQHPYFLVALRVLAGCANGLIDPAIYSLWSQWAPVSERGQLTAVDYSGIGVAGILTFLISAFLCKIPVDNGWPFVFYFYGSLSLAFTLLWCCLARDSPETHSSITDSELRYITQHRSEILHSDKMAPPWLSILKSGAVWAIMVAQISFSWVFSWILAYLPMYMQDVLHYDIAQNGVLSSVPFAGKLVVGILGGYLSDMLLVQKKLSIVCVRKSFQLIGSVGCAVPLLIISFLTHEQRVGAVVLLVVSVSLQNLTSVAYRINSLDIAPRYAGFLMGMSSTVACALTLTAPYVTSALLGSKSRENWQRVLYIVAAMSAAGGVVFLLCAKGHVQKWARDQGLQIEVPSPSLNEPAPDSDVKRLSHKDDAVFERLLTPSGGDLTNDRSTVHPDGNVQL
ncbi:hypothetical protein ACOMHN_022197 [Nucella lapillus]